MDKLIIGSHVSFNKDEQLVGSLNEALSYDANTFMFYTGAPQNTNRAVIDDSKTKEALDKMKDMGIDTSKIIVHAPYIINLGNTEKPDSYRFAIEFLKQEIERCERLGIYNLVLHPGSSVNLTRDEGIENIINALNMAIKEDQNVMILLETMAGKGSEVGRTFHEIKRIMDGVNYKNKLGVCLDTCHLSDADYDVSDFDKLLDEFDNIVGIEHIKCVHVNDSKNPRGAHKDRHENIGYGTLGFDTLLSVIYNPRLANVPKILETPYVGDADNDRMYPPYKFEIDMIRKKEFNSNLINDVVDYYK